MRPARFLSIVGCIVGLGVVASPAVAAPAPQEPVSVTRWNVAGPMASPTLQAAILVSVERIFPAEVIARWPVRFVSLQPDAYLVSHPALHWRVEQEPAARAMAEELATLTPGWSTAVHDGPYGHGVYLIYRHDS
jgi:hypothetical protein